MYNTRIAIVVVRTFVGSSLYCLLFADVERASYDEDDIALPFSSLAQFSSSLRHFSGKINCS